MQTNLSGNWISQHTALEDAFSALSRQDRQAAYDVVRSKVGNRSISLIELVEAHRQLRSVV
jgi:hypothetical protein